MALRVAGGALRAAAVAGAVAALLAGCSTISDPINAPLGIEDIANDQQPDMISAGGPIDDTMVALSFSGGGTRAAAFAHGVLKGLAATSIDSNGHKGTLIEEVDIVSGVSGGSVTAAYFGLKGPAALNDFRERFLIRNAEEGLHTIVASPITLARAASGGANNRENLPQWLDANLFNGATFGNILARKRPIVWINASDIYNRTPFIFDRQTFAAFCSDLGKLPLSEGVAASAAVPVVFAPVTLKTYGSNCGYKQPPWVERALTSSDTPALLRAVAQGLDRYRDPEVMKYVKLLDGGLTDNFGLQGFMMARASAETPFAPMTPQEAVKVRRMLFLVVNSGRAPSGDWAKTIEGPGTFGLIMAVTDTAIDASVRSGYEAFRGMLTKWQDDVVNWRCKLSTAEVKRLRGTTAGWNCRDVKFHLSQVTFADVPEMKPKLEVIETRFVLPQAQVDLLIDAGEKALENNSGFRGFMAAFRQGPATGERIAPSSGGPSAQRIAPSGVAPGAERIGPSTQ